MSQIESIGCLGVTVLVFALLAILGMWNPPETPTLDLKSDGAEHG